MKSSGFRICLIIILSIVFRLMSAVDIYASEKGFILELASAFVDNSSFINSSFINSPFISNPLSTGDFAHIADCASGSVIDTSHTDKFVSPKIKHVVGIDFRPSYVFPTHRFFEGMNNSGKKINTNLTGHLKYGFKFSSNTLNGRMYPHTVQGLGVAYNTFDNSSELGNPFAVYVFQTSRIATISSNLSFDYEWNFGASFGWKNYDEVSNPNNTVVGSKTNAYINVGFLFNWRISPSTNLRAGFGLTHFSNGNTEYPNAGVNTIGASVGISHFFGNNRENETVITTSKDVQYRDVFKNFVTYDLIVYGAARKKGIMPEGENPLMVPGSFCIIGLNFNPLYNFNKYFRAGLSLDVQYDESANIEGYIANDYMPSDPGELKFYRPSFKEQFSTGISVRAEVVMSIFSINLGVGKNFVCKGKDTDSSYQTFVLKTNITKNIFLHTGYQLYRFKDPNNLMLGIGYRFNTGR